MRKSFPACNLAQAVILGVTHWYVVRIDPSLLCKACQCCHRPCRHITITTLLAYQIGRRRDWTCKGTWLTTSTACMYTKAFFRPKMMSCGTIGMQGPD